MDLDERSLKPSQAPRLMALDVMGLEIHLHISGSRADELVSEVLATWDRCNARVLEMSDESAIDESLIVRAMLDDDEALVEQAWGDGIIASTLLDGVTEQLSPMVTQRGIDRYAGERLMLHASGLAEAQTGRTAVLVGPSGAGKSTATRALAGRFAYVSDETVCMDSSLGIAAYPKPLSLFPDGRAWGKEQISPTKLGLDTPPNDLSVGALLVLSRKPDGPMEPVVTPLSTAEAILRLGEQTSYLGRLEQPLSRLTELIRAAGGAHLVEYREASALIDVVTRLLKPGPALSAVPGEAVPPSVVRSAAEGVSEAGALLRRSDLADFCIEDGVGVAFCGGRLVALSELATCILQLLEAGPLSSADLTSSLLVAFGVPEGADPTALTRSVVDELRRNGLLTYL